MFKTFFRTLTFFLGAALLCGITLAQQSSTPSTQQPSASKPASSAPKTQQSTTSKTGTSTPTKKTAPPPLVLTTPKDKNSYAIGLNIGKSLQKDAVEVDPDIISRAIKDVIAGAKPLLTDEETQATLTALSNEVRKHQQEVFEQTKAKNKQEGEAFLAANKDKPGVVVLPSGLQYKVLQEGTGPKPTAGDSVVCQYRGTLLDGSEFDSSYKRGKPATFNLNRVIKGWIEALPLMPVGSKWQLYVPSSLAYGEQGNGPIGPNSTLIFDLELVSIVPRPQPPQPKLEPVGPAGQSQVPPQAQPQAAPQAQPQASPQVQPQTQAPPPSKPQ
ncbi:MAG TPA: FKBP-type peptidyl-prolyl cis-trans isomerase [Candidatus Limnocylindrales bacterium]|nr:FKBP-type peptidyl-prolyl cis-trans isomerase [Candidatus Limnocylindrales bacterium]